MAVHEGLPTQLNECQFADDANLLATTRSGAEQAILAYIEATKAFELSMSFHNTKLMVIGFGIIGDRGNAPILVRDSEVLNNSQILAPLLH